MIWDFDNVRMPAWLNVGRAMTRYQPLPSLTKSIGVHNIELFDPAHLTLWNFRP